MKTWIGGAALAAMAVALGASPAIAGSPDGQLQIKVLGTMVDPDGSIDEVILNPGLPAGTDTAGDTNYVPTLAIEYFVTPNVSLETICCMTQHDVDAVSPAALAGGQLVSNANIVPATLTLKYHLGEPGGFQPYIGAGPTYFIFIDEQPGAAARTVLGATRQRMNDHFGFALQAGFDMPINDQGVGLTVDVKRYFLSTTAHWFNATGTEILTTRHNIDPWVISAGIAYRF